MICNRDILITGLQNIDFSMGSNAVNLAFEFSKNNRVLYINYPLDRFTIWKNRNRADVRNRLEIIRGKSPGLVKVKDNLWALNPPVILESINRIPFTGLFNYMNRLNNSRFAVSIKDALDKLDFSDIIWFNDSDFYRVFHLREFIDIKLSIYYSRDNMIATSYFKRHGKRMEGAFMKKADAVVSNSTFLQKAALKYNSNAFCVGQGCDVSAFNKRFVDSFPEDVKNLKKPILGYIGALVSFRLDIELISFISSQLPAWTIVLVGPEDEAFKKSYLHKLSNIKFLGRKDQSELPQYLASFDVAFNPQIINQITIGNYPRKVDEYLAMGKPVVATRTEGMEVFEEFVYLADSKEDYIALIEKAINDDTPEQQQKREDFARRHTWEANALAIYTVMEKFLSSFNIDKMVSNVNRTTD